MSDAAREHIRGWLEDRAEKYEREIAALKAKLAAAESACREALTYIQTVMPMDDLHTKDESHCPDCGLYWKLRAIVGPADRAVLAGDGEAK